MRVMTTGHPAVGDGAGVKLALFTSLRGHDWGWLRGDVAAGLTVWAVLVPEARSPTPRSWACRRWSGSTPLPALPALGWDELLGLLPRR